MSFFSKKIDQLVKEVAACRELYLQLNAPVVQLELNDPWFGLAHNGTKQYEGRRSTPRLKALKAGDQIDVFRYTDFAVMMISMTVVEILEFPTFEIALRELPLEQVLPGVKTIEEGVEIYKKFVSLATQEREGVVMIKWIRK
jgi:ASC-1-like (ASCH) protein